MTTQTRCGTMALHHRLVAQSPVYVAERRRVEREVLSNRRGVLPDVVTIPVVVHCVYSDPFQCVSERQIHEQIDRLNIDFRAQNPDRDTVPDGFNHLVADARIEFELAKQDPYGTETNGFAHHQTCIPSFESADTCRIREWDLKSAGTGAPAWDPASYLNIWVCNLGEYLAGFATLPIDDPRSEEYPLQGVAIDYRCFGQSNTKPGYNLGRTAVHEIGHWLNLLHLWGDHEGDCTESDNVADTPLQLAPNVRRPVHPSPSCQNSGDLFMNFMDHVDDQVMVMFTRGQVARMHETLQIVRQGLLTSLGLHPPDTALSPIGPARAPDIAISEADSSPDLLDVFEDANTFKVAPESGPGRELPPPRLEDIDTASVASTGVIFDGVGWVSIEEFEKQFR